MRFVYIHLKTLFIFHYVCHLVALICDPVSLILQLALHFDVTVTGYQPHPLTLLSYTLEEM